MEEEDDIEMEPSSESKANDFLTSAKIENDSPSNTSTHSFHRTMTGRDDSYSFRNFSEEFQIKFVKIGEEEVEFDMIGIDAPIANAFRRIMLSEIPTIAFDRVVVNNNTSVLPDEVLAHRIGLVPIKADPRMFRTKDKMKRELKQSLLEFEKDKPQEGEYKPLLNLKCNEDLLFRLRVVCSRSSSNPRILENEKIYSKHLEWVPFGDQEKRFDSGIRPVFEDILLCQLSPDQVIDLELYAEKGIGRTHAKWSPVSTASYRLKPEVRILQKLSGEEAEKMKKKCPRSVFDIEDSLLIVKDPRRCSFCKECIRDDENPCVKLGKNKRHFIFSVESTGIYSAIEIFREAVGVFYNKIRNKDEVFDQVLNQVDHGEKVLY